MPLLTPTIFFNLVMGIIGSFQVFTAAYIMQRPGRAAELALFYVLYLFQQAFSFIHGLCLGDGHPAVPADPGADLAGIQVVPVVGVLRDRGAQVKAQTRAQAGNVDERQCCSQ